MSLAVAAVFTSLLASGAVATTHFEESFADGAAWEDRWVQSSAADEDERGSLTLTAGKWGDDVGLQTGPDARFFQYSSAFASPVDTTEGSTLVTQYSVKMEEKVTCGGSYVKVLRAGYDAASFDGSTDYAVMFGPDICGFKRIHAILNYNGNNLEWKKTVSPETDALTHVYTFVVRADNTYTVLVDEVEKASGDLLEDWDFLEPREIPDPAVSKPEDWVNEKMMDDPEDVKPANWDDEPETIADPEATMPEDWDVEDDGEWEAPMIENTEFKGIWRAKRMENPAYAGEWEHPLVANADFVDDATPYVQQKLGGVALELWQVTTGVVFDNFYVGDDEAEAHSRAEAVIAARVTEEEQYTAIQEVEEAKAEAARMAAGSDDEGDEGHWSDTDEEDNERNLAENVIDYELANEDDDEL